MSVSLMLVLMNGIFVCGYSGLLFYYGIGSLIARDLVWRTLSKQLLPGIVFALFMSLMVLAGQLLADIMGYYTIWWPNSPVL